MNIKSADSSAQKSISFPALSLLGCAGNKSGGVLNSENAVNKIGGVESRKGFKVNPYSTVVGQNGLEISEYKTVFSGVINGINTTLGMIHEEDIQYNTSYKFFSIADTGSVTYIDTITYNQTGFTVIHPESIVVLKGAPAKGCGIYVFLSVYKSATNMCELHMYELNVQMNAFIPIEYSDTYLPEYYKNGRGTSYEESGLKLPNPEFVQPLNMLNNKCKCSFTSDGLSSVFYLPFKGIGNIGALSISVKITEQKILYFNIAANRDVSNEVSYAGDTYVVFVNRETGAVELFCNVTPYAPIHLPGSFNNIVVFSEYNNTPYLNLFADISVGGYINTGSSGNRICLAGISSNPEKVLVSMPETPLYFSSADIINVGFPGQAITHIHSFRGETVFFKENEIYSVSFNKSSVRCRHISGTIGCSKYSAVAECCGALMWFYKNKVYVLNELANPPKPVTREHEFLPQSPSGICRAGAVGDYCYILFDDYIFAADFTGGISYSIWRFSSEFQPKGVTPHGNFVFKCGPVYYTACLNGNYLCDEYYKYISGTVSKQTAPYTCVIKISDVKGEKFELKKYFQSVYVNMYSESAAVDFLIGESDIAKSLSIVMEQSAESIPKTIKLLPFIVSTGIGMAFSSSNYICINGISLNYRLLENN